MQAKNFFKRNIHKAGECYNTPSVEAHRVKAGDAIVTEEGIKIANKKDEGNWQVMIGNDFRVMSNTDFKKSYRFVSGEKHKKLPKNTFVEKVLKGREILVHPFPDSDIGVEMKTEVDGIVVTLPDSKSFFMSNSDFSEKFGINAAPPTDTIQHNLFQRIPSEDEEPLRYIRLDKDTNFEFKRNSYVVSAGSVLLEKSKDEKGFTHISAGQFAQNFIVKETSKDRSYQLTI